MRDRRQTHGALQLDTLEARPVFEDEKLVDMRPDPRNRAKDLIEDCMVGANGVTARYLDAKGFSSLRRVLKTPKRWDRIVQLAATLGYAAAFTARRAALDGFLKSRRKADPDRFQDLSLSVIKLLGRRICLGASRSTNRRSLRSGGARLHALNRAKSQISRFDHAAAVEGCHFRTSLALY